MGLYETLKAAKIGAAFDVFTTLRGRQAPFAKGGATEKELEDTPPLSFSANGEPLIDWHIDGASGNVGDKTSNLYEFPYTQKLSLSGSGNNRTVISSVYTQSNIVSLSPNTTYTLSGNRAESTDYFGRLALFSEYPEVDSVSTHFYAYNSTTTPSVTFTTGENEIYALIFSNGAADLTTDYKMMFNEGSTALPYEPHGYKISVTCGGETKTIYLDEPLGASDSISMTDTGISIPTVDGSNTLSVGTTVQPSSVYIKYKE